MTPEKQAADLVGLATRLDGWFHGGIRDPFKYASEPIGPLLNEAAKVVRAVAMVREALEQISKGEGAFNRDPLKHAENVINEHKAQSRAALDLLDKIGTKP